MPPPWHGEPILPIGGFAARAVEPFPGVGLPDAQSAGGSSADLTEPRPPFVVMTCSFDVILPFDHAEVLRRRIEGPRSNAIPFGEGPRRMDARRCHAGRGRDGFRLPVPIGPGLRR